ncbi:WD40 repeat domain-containing protein [bacterium]|nr:MAG: WD40 repeat domain-containing protein [bacterium]
MSKILLYKIFVRMFLIMSMVPTHSSAVVVGSNTAVSRQAFTTFPVADVDNEVRGFTSMTQGFAIEDGNASCIYNAYFPVEQTICLGGGTLSLSEDLVLSNTTIIIGLVPTIGRFLGGNGQSIKFPAAVDSLTIPLVSFLPKSLVSTTTNAAISSIDWSPDSKYIAVGLAQNAGAEMLIYYFDGTTLTMTNALSTGAPVGQTVDQGVTVVRWHPFDNYIAFGTTEDLGDDFVIGKLNVSNGQFTSPDGGWLTGICKTIGWHPAGDYLVVGSSNLAKELILYKFDRAMGTFNTNPGGIFDFDITTPVNGAATSADSLSWAPGGNLFAVGTTALLVMNFSPSPSLSLNSNVNLGIAINAVDWSPTGTYIAAGLAASNETLRIYAHNAANSTLTEIKTAYVGLSTAVTSLQWDSTGTFLRVGNASPALLRTYYFDQTSLTLTLIDVVSAVGATTVRWSPNDQYLADANNLTLNIRKVYTTLPLTFENVRLIFSSDVIINKQWKFKGTCDVVATGGVLSFAREGSILLAPGTNLTFDGVTLSSVGGSNISCMDNAGTVTFRNSQLFFSREFSFSTGSMGFESEVMFSGTVKINYTTRMTSTIGSGATWALDQGISFSYAPAIARKTLIRLEDPTSMWYLNGTTIFSTVTGLQLSRGTLVVDNHVTLSSQARNSGEAMILSNNLNVNILSGGLLDIYGFVRYS